MNYQDLLTTESDEKKKEQEVLNKELSNIEKRALVIQTLYLMYPEEENEDLVFNILPN